MDVKAAIQELNAFRISINDRKTLELLDLWNALLLEISAFELLPVEEEVLHTELNMYLTKFKNNTITASLVKNALRAFLKTVKRQLRAKDQFQYTTTGIFVGLLLCIPLRTHFLLGLFLGILGGWLLDVYYNRKQRYISVNLNSVW